MSDDRWPKPGDKMRFLGKNGYPFELEEAMKVMSPGDVFTVKSGSVGGFSNSIRFAEIDGSWNGVMFEFVTPMTAPVPSDGPAGLRDYWLQYDHQVGRWVVQNEPFTVIRTGAEVIHTREVGPAGESGDLIEPVAWLDMRNEPAEDWTTRVVATNPEFVTNNGPENFVALVPASALAAYQAKVGGLEGRIEIDKETINNLYVHAKGLEAKVAALTAEIEALKAETRQLGDASVETEAACHQLARDAINAEKRAEASEASAAALRTALEPFAKMADSYDPPEGDDDLPIWDTHDLTIGHLRAARAALPAKGEG